MREKFIRIGNYELEKIASKITTEVIEIARQNDLTTDKAASSLAKFVISQYEKYRQEMGI